ncbi:hypothetical protein AUJ84_02110 [Candidatus Pacearchaeota archaeon CG1_02_32_132]|nr:MAG: hypothetical protein AUJ84_02110 [Candidatus Pacearchaeota archaeon CG1_02_32_132]
MKHELKGKTILITGGTGFLGRNLVAEILKHKPKSIRVFSRDEVKHHILQEKFIRHKDVIRTLIGDVRDYERLERAMRGCDIVIHAAALKRIDMIEYNVDESIKTNILGSLNVIRAALINKVDKVILVSSDKACSPVNTYGACKFVAERIFVENNFSKGNAKTTFSCVRYGNVLQSTGSVIPFFLSKIKNNEDIPLTNPDMTRFIITPNHAVELIFNAIKYGEGGEIFIPRLPAFKITDLINYLKEKNNSNNKVKLVGIRPGEKIHELMINSSEVSRTFEFQNMYVITSQIQKYLDRINYNYLKNKKRTGLEEYSSNDAVLPYDKLKRYLDSIDLEKWIK